MPRRVAFLIYPDFQLLDVAGPIAAFEIMRRSFLRMLDTSPSALKRGQGAARKLH